MLKYTEIILCPEDMEMGLAREGYEETVLVSRGNWFTQVYASAKTQ